MLSKKIGLTRRPCYSIANLTLVPNAVPLNMSQVNKMIAKMRHNPTDWRIEDLVKIAERFEIDYRQPGTSHVTFRAKKGQRITVPSHKPIKPIYIKKFLEMLDSMGVL
ncbi:MAG: hypothetical protein KIT27_01620 [Legionellales bacterium]|nr:hypothetical protein [Legionellales bacterium]